ncbi:hypothetical protein TNCV_1523851 [Trichonephila clavipes]|nr:hypothetical protein TNCV_1523851 [Trichonephila clavipes]
MAVRCLPGNSSSRYSSKVTSKLWSRYPPMSSKKIDKIGNVIEEVSDLARQINSVVDSDTVQEMLGSHNQELIIDELLEMHEQEQDIEELESLDPVQSEDRMTVGILIDGSIKLKEGYKF